MNNIFSFSQFDNVILSADLAVIVFKLIISNIAIEILNCSWLYFFNLISYHTGGTFHLNRVFEGI